jgi:hypothetical protein
MHKQQKLNFETIAKLQKIESQKQQEVDELSKNAANETETRTKLEKQVKDFQNILSKT